LHHTPVGGLKYVFHYFAQVCNILQHAANMMRDDDDDDDDENPQ